MNRPHIPAFGSWDYCDDLPITQYFESAMQAGLVRGRPFGEDADFLKVTADTVKPTHHHHHHHHHQRKVLNLLPGTRVLRLFALILAHQVKKPGERQYQQGQQRKQGKASDVTAQATPRRPRAAKAVDEDLYKIPPELLYQKPKRKRLLKGLWSGCLGLHCTAYKSELPTYYMNTVFENRMVSSH
ncbi:unnamed protein product [Musa hybrid cultivar]